jgi:hypothetical protein
VAAFGQFTTLHLRFNPTFDDPLKASLGDVLLRPDVFQIISLSRLISFFTIASAHMSATRHVCSDAEIMKKIAWRHSFFMNARLHTDLSLNAQGIEKHFLHLRKK